MYTGQRRGERPLSNETYYRSKRDLLPTNTGLHGTARHVPLRRAPGWRRWCEWREAHRPEVGADVSWRLAGLPLYFTTELLYFTTELLYFTTELLYLLYFTTVIYFRCAEVDAVFAGFLAGPVFGFRVWGFGRCRCRAHKYLYTHHVLQVGLRLRFCTGAQDTVLRVCAGMKAEPGDELSVSQV